MIPFFLFGFVSPVSSDAPRDCFFFSAPGQKEGEKEGGWGRGVASVTLCGGFRRQISKKKKKKKGSARGEVRREQ